MYDYTIESPSRDHVIEEYILETRWLHECGLSYGTLMVLLHLAVQAEWVPGTGWLVEATPESVGDPNYGAVSRATSFRAFSDLEQRRIIKRLTHGRVALLPKVGWEL